MECKDSVGKNHIFKFEISQKDVPKDIVYPKLDMSFEKK